MKNEKLKTQLKNTMIWTQIRTGIPSCLLKENTKSGKNENMYFFSK